MNAPSFSPPMEVAPSTYQLGAWVPIPDLGWLPVNAYLIQGAQPVLVDTGLALFRNEFLAAVANLVDLADIRHVWVTHMDADHVGNLGAILEACPQARVVTTPLGIAKMGLLGLPADRAQPLQPGDVLDLGDRQLRAIAPPVFDAPETMGFMDSRTRALFTSDCFGTLQERPTQWAREIPRSSLQRGMVQWANIDAPWLQVVDRSAWGVRLKALVDLQPDVTLCSHLQPAQAMVHQLADVLGAAPLGVPA